MNRVSQDLSLNSKESGRPINVQIRTHEIDTEDWELHEAARELYFWNALFNKEFFNSQLSQAVLSFERTRADCYGHYVVEKNGIGVEDNINLNYKYLDREKWQILVTLLHEMTHQYQRRIGSFSRDKGHKRRSYHNKEFQDLMASFGLTCDSRGCLSETPRDPFVSLLKRHGIEIDCKFREDDGFIIDDREMGNSKLKKFSCACNPPINVRVADSRFSAKCNHCKQDFKQALNKRNER